jgi:dipeptidyl aminopeptidase/acylaminoacyl peptidase
VSATWASVEGLAWSADGTEIWFSAARAGSERQIYAVDQSGHQRLIFRAPGGVTLQDIGSDGRVLVTRDEERNGMMALAPGAATESDLSWRDWSVPSDISADGNTVLFDEQGVESGPTYTVALRDLRGSPPIPIGQGMAGKLSPDGKWASTIISNARLLLLPAGAGTAKQLSPGDIQQYWYGAWWIPDGKEVVFSANRIGHGVQCFVQDVDGGNPRPVTRQADRGQWSWWSRRLVVSRGWWSATPDTRLGSGRTFRMDLKSAIFVRVPVETITGQGLSHEHSDRTETVVHRNNSARRRGSS